MLFLSPTQRAAESAVARSMVESLIRNHVPLSAPLPAVIVAHEFGMACERSRFTPTESAANRILATVAADIAERRRAAERLNDALVTGTKSLRACCNRG